MKEQTYPSGRVVKNLLQSDGDLAVIASRVANGVYKNYAAGFGYTATGVIQHLQLGNGLWESGSVNSRGQVTELKLGNSPTNGGVWSLNFAYGEFDTNGNIDATKNASNIVQQTITVPGVTNAFVQKYKYDSLDRLSEARETNNSNQTWIQTFGYDRYGNRTSRAQTVGSTQMPINAVTLPTVDDDRNRYNTGQGYTYDAVGNLIGDTSGRSYTFNGDNKQVAVIDGSNNIGTYAYDGNGKRVKKTANGEDTIFVYDGMGKLVAEYSNATPVTNPTVNYTATDPLGSPRVLTNKKGEVVSRRDFMPFGEEITPDGTYRTTTAKYGAADKVRQKFTGYERDEETGLDFAQARYYYDVHGRFTAVDPLLASGKSANPQTFNRYAYAMGRPLVLIDPTGLQAVTNPNSSPAKTLKRVSSPNQVPKSVSSNDPLPPDRPKVTSYSMDVGPVQEATGKEIVLPDGQVVTGMDNKPVKAHGFFLVVEYTFMDDDGNSAKPSDVETKERVTADNVTPADAEPIARNSTQRQDFANLSPGGKLYDVVGVFGSKKDIKDAGKLGMKVEQSQTITVRQGSDLYEIKNKISISLSDQEKGKIRVNQ